MALWLFKEEPDSYTYADLERDGETLWDGVTNNLARKHLRTVKKGDRILFYHTGKEKAVMGEMKASTDALIDPNGEDPKAVAVKVRPVRAWAVPVTLERIKKDPQLSDGDLVRLPRLSIVPMTQEQWQRVEALAKTGA